MPNYVFVFGIPTLLAICGGIITLAGFRMGEDMAVSFRQAYTAKAFGTVLATRIENVVSGGYRHFPVVRFTTGQGHTVEFRSPVHSSSRRYRPGVRVPVAYDPVHPDHARIDTYMRGVPLTVTIIGTRLAALSLLWLFLTFLVVALQNNTARLGP